MTCFFFQHKFGFSIEVTNTKLHLKNVSEGKASSKVPLISADCLRLSLSCEILVLFCIFFCIYKVFSAMKILKSPLYQTKCSWGVTIKCQMLDVIINLETFLQITIDMWLLVQIFGFVTNDWVDNRPLLFSSNTFIAQMFWSYFFEINICHSIIWM